MNEMRQAHRAIVLRTVFILFFLSSQHPCSHQIVKGNFLTPEPGWKCVLAFFAFDGDVPGSNR